MFACLGLALSVIRDGNNRVVLTTRPAVRLPPKMAVSRSESKARAPSPLFRIPTVGCLYPALGRMDVAITKQQREHDDDDHRARRGERLARRRGDDSDFTMPPPHRALRTQEAGTKTNQDCCA